ncbi:hypothetical protein VC83_03096 [Pseudogymnoascus destructans]|uniref:ferric-chelate reductase (NADPH) n=2 Tax=Pseudogymnoascus destructans TaxID=655981 RepID=L8FT99_PSED2|nr:uncharacterized protein VC83_03096 [Pseudogymnoascus destructans]ELR04190.1 hypothetical protein GMDG_06612 [Pseudogymnoascus destructans 20631-21]OAF60226.1 hypothetical protein VC83_03096 [Pseudogymnoascus destructans]
MGMDMNMGMGMDMSSDSAAFVHTNSSMARSYWYIIAAVLGFTALLRIFQIAETRTRLRLAKLRAVQHPTRPRNALGQAFATGSAILREIAAPKYHINNRWVSWLSPPSLGRSLIVVIYMAVILYMLLWHSITFDAYYYEKVAFRAAWVSATQVPFVYLLASKASLIGLLSGSSHERINWLHRWVSRTLLVTVTVHGGFFYVEWYRADLVEVELQMMTMVKYGIGAWSVLAWTFITSLTPIRSFSYELFVLQHIAAAAVFLWLLWMHVPAYARYNIWFAIAALVFDKLAMYAWTAWTNAPASGRTGSGLSKFIGHRAEIRAVNTEMTEVIIHDVQFKWAAGQHIYLRIPSIGPLEAHPFTIASVCSDTSSASSIQLLVEKRGGFTKRLHAAATKEQDKGVTAIITGPLGRPPTWAAFETLILISASTGITFTLPILESMVNNTDGLSCVRRIEMLHVVRKRDSTDCYIGRVKAAITAAERVGIALTVRIAVTCGTSTGTKSCFGSNNQCHSFDMAPNFAVEVSNPTAAAAATQKSDVERGIIPIETRPITPSTDKGDFTSIMIERPPTWTRTNSAESETTTLLKTNRQIIYSSSRPDIGAFIRRPVEVTAGETLITVCGGESIVACVRNHVAALSDERGVHKGTGAQGIALFTEHYCF